MNMQLVTADQQYNSLVECNYSHPQEVFDDVTTVATRFPKLQVYVDYYFYPNKEKKKLVNLAGTVPITYDGSLYNIPVRIWIHETHPKNPPRCYVCPASSTVVNTKSSNVDESGCVLLHCLKNWKTGRSNLSVVLEEMIAAFHHETPLFARSLLPSEEVQASQVSCSSWPHGDSCFAQEPSQAQHGPSVLCATQSGGSTVCSKNAKSPNCLDQARRKNMSGGKRHTSYTQELLDFGITFGAQDHQTNPFISAAPASSNRTSNSDDVDDLFKGLNLQSDVDVNQFDCRDKHGTEAGVGLQDCAGGLPGPPVLVASYNKVVVSGLPVGASPGRIKNKLTIYFQRKNNAGREVLDVRYPALQPDQAWVFFRNQEDAKHILKQPERTFEINEQQCVIRLTQSEDVEIPDGVQGEKAEMFKSIMSLGRCGFRSEDILEAVQSCRDISSALNYLCHDCPICQEQVSFNRMVTMTHCSCTFCENCFKKYFSSVIKEKSIVHVVCPICNLPDVRGCRREESMEYFSLLDTQIKYYLDPQIHELFQRKLRDKALQEIPNFRWCAHCCFGLLHEADRLRMDCPSCRKSTCFQCKKPWAPQHDGISCEKFKEWEQINCPEYQNSKLEQILSRNKIDCPKCKFRFLLARGGCLHFKCTQCQHEFCGGCSRPFKQGSACDFSSECGAKGLHAHHPRDCLYHLRDWSVPRLRNLLQFYGLSHSLMFSPKCPTEKHFKVTCGVMEFQETSAVKEEPCGRPAFPEYSGYCMVHYKECLVELINQNSLDPVVLLDRVELCTEMARWKVQLPVKLHSETDLQYDDRLRQILKERVGLVYAGPSGLHKATAPTSSPSSPPAAAAPGTAWFSMLTRPVSEDSVQLLLLTD